MAKDKRFKRIYEQGNIRGTEIWIDLETGVNYLFVYNGNAGGLTVLLDEHGQPVITSKESYKES